jgi:hypothetical protein
MTTRAVGLLQIGTDLAEKHIGRDADRAGKAFADLLTQDPLDLEREFARDRHLPFGAHEPAGHFINRHDLLDRQTGIDGFQNAAVIVGVEPVIGLHRDDRGAQPPRFAHERAGLDAEGFGRVTRRNGTGGVRERLHDDDGLAAQRRIFLLLARRKEGVEIEEQPLDVVFGR